MKKSKSNPELKNIIEAALLVAGEPLTLERLAALFPEGSHPGREQLRAAIDELEKDYASRGIELRQIEKGWRIQTREKYAGYVARAVEARPPRYSRALLETLAIIAYRQPVTRGDMEDIRGVTINSLILKQLEDRNWVEVIGHRETVGRPALYATTRQFLDDLGLASLDQLPVIETPAQQAALVDSLERAGGGDQPALPIDEPPAETEPAPAADETAVAVAAEEAQTGTTPSEQPEVQPAIADDASLADEAIADEIVATDSVPVEPDMAPEPGNAAALDERGDDAEQPAPAEAQASADTEPSEEPRIDPDAPPPDATDPDAVLPGKTS